MQRTDRRLPANELDTDDQNAIAAPKLLSDDSFGIIRILCLTNPVRQCILRGHSLLKQEFYLNNTILNTFYPDLFFAGLPARQIILAGQGTARVKSENSRRGARGPAWTGTSNDEARHPNKRDRRFPQK